MDVGVMDQRFSLSGTGKENLWCPSRIPTQETLTSKSTTHLMSVAYLLRGYGTFFDPGFNVQVLDYYMNY